MPDPDPPGETVPSPYDCGGALPLVPVCLEGGPEIWCKLEFMNPSGSTKDRIARHILGRALNSGALRAGGWVIEASSGSTSISMALVAAQLGLRFLAVMPEGVSTERTLIIRALGGEVMLSPKAGGMAGAIATSEAEAEARDGFLPKQFCNPENAQAHRLHTAREIVAQIPGGRIDAVVSGVGTGGTLVGLWRGFEDVGLAPLPVAAIPRSVSGGLSELECSSFSRRIPGVIDGMSQIYADAALPGGEEIEVDDEDAICTTRALIARGFPVGPSSGLNFCAAKAIAGRLGPDAQIVTVFPDRMERYFSTELFANCKDHPPLS